MPQKTNKTKAQTPERSERMKDTWNRITGILSVYGNEFKSKNGGTIVKWSTSVSNKKEDGSFDRYYLLVRFAGSVKAPDKPGLHQIDVVNAFLSCQRWTSKDGDEYVDPVLVITDGEVVE